MSSDLRTVMALRLPKNLGGVTERSKVGDLGSPTRASTRVEGSNPSPSTLKGKRRASSTARQGDRAIMSLAA